MYQVVMSESYEPKFAAALRGRRSDPERFMTSNHIASSHPSDFYWAVKLIATSFFRSWLPRPINLDSSMGIFKTAPIVQLGSERIYQIQFLSKFEVAALDFRLSN